MSNAFQYRPKFVDIRVRPPRKGEEDVMGLKPGERRCDHAGCIAVATAKAPKSPERLSEHYWFCQPHAAEYNKTWNFFAGMNQAEADTVREQAFTGDRPTWAFKASRASREAAAFAAGAGRAARDPFGLFRAARAKADAEAEEHARRLGRLERTALADLDLEESADAVKIRTRYTELIKRCHPDANGGDRSAEHKLQRVLKAYKTLQKAKLV